MTVSAYNAAHYLCKISNWKLSNLQVQKILYLADMNYLGQNGDRLIDEDFQAWDYGPVLSSLYQHCKAFGSKSLPDIFWGADDVSNTQEAKMLDTAYQNLKVRKPHDLVAITHSPLGAWIQRYIAGAREIIITTGDMNDEYTRRREDREHRAN